MSLINRYKHLFYIGFFAFLGLGLGACTMSMGGGDSASTDDKDSASESADDDSSEKKDDKNTADTKSKDGKGKDKKEPDPVPVEAAKVARRPMSASYAGTANLEAPADAQVVAKTSGVMLQLLAEEGDQVKAGQVLARLDPERVRLEAARAEATMRRLENNYRRSQELFGRKLVSAEANDQLRYEYESAKAAWELTKLELSYTAITAPISGVIAQRMAKPGNLIQANSAVFRIVDNSRLEAVLNLPEREMATMKAGLPIQMVVDALPGKVFQGNVGRISPVVDSSSGTFRVVGVFTSNELLRPGMFGRLQIVYDQRAEVLTVPRLALLEEGADAAVFVVRGEGETSKAERKNVTLGHINGEFAEIVTGLSEGERVVTAGKVAIRDGARINVLGDPVGKKNADSASAKTAQASGR